MAWRWLDALVARWRAILRGRRADADLTDELSFHLAMQSEWNRKQGMSPQDADRHARITLGGFEQAKELDRDVRPLRILRSVSSAVKQASRSLRRSPLFAGLALTTLTVGITATLLVLVVTRSVLWTSLPYPDPDRLVMVWERTPTGEPRNFVSAFNFIRWQERAAAFEAIGAVQPLTVNVAGAGDAEQIDALAVTSGFFEAVGVKPLLGRAFVRADDATRPPRAVVLSYAFWQSRYGGGVDVIGKTLVANGTPREIVGVMPDGFAFAATRAAQLYTSFPLDPSAPPGGRSLVTVARLTRGASVESARRDMARVTAQLAIEAPRADRGFGASVFPLFDEIVGRVRQPLRVIAAAVACLLVLTLVNIANLLLIRAARRRPEVALRLALGGGHRRLVEYFCAEAVMLTSAASALSLLIAAAVVPRLPDLLVNALALPRAQEIRLDGVVAAVTLTGAVVVGIVFGLLHAAQAPRVALAETLRTGSRSSSAGQQRLRRTLVVVEVAAALVLVFAATVMGRSFAALTRVDPGFDTTRVLTFQTTLIPRKYPRREQIPPVIERMLAELGTVPGVSAAGSIHFLPLSGIASGAPVYRADRPAPSRDQLLSSPVSVISRGYFRTMGIPLRGRDFDDRDTLDSPGAVIVSEALARRDFHGEDPIGHHVAVLYGLKSDFEIVGVAGDVRTGTLDEAAAPVVYLPVSQEPSANVALVVRSDQPVETIAPSVRAALSRVDPDQGIRTARLSDVIDGAVSGPRLEAGVAGGFGGIALLIAAVGLYGVIAYNVEQRRREMGIVLALGASPRGLFRTVLAEGLRLAAIGAGVGIAGAWAAAGVLQDLLFNVSARDPRIFAGVAMVLFVTAVIAATVPAIRALRLDPLIVLRNE